MPGREQKPEECVPMKHTGSGTQQKFNSRMQPDS